MPWVGINTAARASTSSADREDDGRTDDMTKHADITPRQDAPCKYFSERGESAIATTPIVVGSHYDIIVIGAGIVGLSAALALAERGVRVHVLEARHIGWGASGRAWGQVAAAAKHTPKEIDATFSPERSWRINETMARIPEIVSETVRRHDIQCEMLESGNLIAAHRPGKEHGLRRLADDLARRGYPVTLLEDAACTTVTGSPRYRVALQDRRGIALNPLAYTRGLARAVLNAGASISENTTVTQLERNAQAGSCKPPKVQSAPKASLSPPMPSPPTACTPESVAKSFLSEPIRRSAVRWTRRY